MKNDRSNKEKTLKATFLGKPVRVFECDLLNPSKKIVRYIRGHSGVVVNQAHRDNIILATTKGFQYYSDSGTDTYPSKDSYCACTRQLERLMRHIASAAKAQGEDISSYGDLHLRQLKETDLDGLTLHVSE